MRVLGTVLSNFMQNERVLIIIITYCYFIIVYVNKNVILEFNIKSSIK